MTPENLAAEGWTRLDIDGFSRVSGGLWTRGKLPELEVGFVSGQPHVNGHMSTVHGGMLLTLADVSLGYAVIQQLAGLLTAGDLVIDGGNSYYQDDQPHADLLAEHGIGFVDAGVSGGVWGLANGYGLMVGGDKAAVDRLLPVFDALRPEGPRAEGFVHAGKVGAGHFAKMVHNGVEYGLMQAYAEGYELLAAKDLVDDVEGTLKAWTRGTVVRSWLLDLLVQALEQDPGLAAIDDWVEDSGEGRWTVDEAIDLAVPAPVISASLFARFASRQEESPALKAVAALRQQFGGHAVKPSGPDGA